MLNFTPAKIIPARKEKLKVSCVVSNIKVFAIVLEAHSELSKISFFFFEKKSYDPLFNRWGSTATEPRRGGS